MLRIGGAFLPGTLMPVYGGFMIFKSVKLLLAAFSFVGSAAFAKVDNKFTDHPGEIQNDSALVAAVNSRRSAFYVEAGNIVVSKLLPDDNSGLRHQKWQARLSNGSTVEVVYNADMGERVPIQVGNSFGVGGEFIWTRGGGLVHWVHSDPSGRRPDGYVFYEGVLYGDEDTGRNNYRRNRR